MRNSFISTRRKYLPVVSKIHFFRSKKSPITLNSVSNSLNRTNNSKNKKKMVMKGGNLLLQNQEINILPKSAGQFVSTSKGKSKPIRFML
jgi:hypothetical protein